MRNRHYAIWDIDNCVADDGWRAHLIDHSLTGNAKYEKYNELMEQDPVAHVEQFKFMCQFTTPVFFTGRCEKWRSNTARWLQRCLDVSGVLMLMRGDHDHRKPVVLKEDMLNELHYKLPFGSIIAAGFDDLDTVVQMYRSRGIAACKLAIHDNQSLIYTPAELAVLHP